MDDQITACDQSRFVGQTGHSDYRGDLLPGMTSASAINIDLEQAVGTGGRDLNPVGDRHRIGIVPADYVLDVDFVVAGTVGEILNVHRRAGGKEKERVRAGAAIQIVGPISAGDRVIASPASN